MSCGDLCGNVWNGIPKRRKVVVVVMLMMTMMMLLGGWLDALLIGMGIVVIMVRWVMVCGERNWRLGGEEGR